MKTYRAEIAFSIAKHNPFSIDRIALNEVDAVLKISHYMEGCYPGAAYRTYNLREIADSTAQPPTHEEPGLIAEMLRLADLHAKLNHHYTAATCEELAEFVAPYERRLIAAETALRHILDAVKDDWSEEGFNIRTIAETGLKQETP